MGSHYYTVQPAGEGFEAKCLPCGHVAAFERTEMEAAVTASLLNKRIEREFEVVGGSRKRGTDLGLSRRMRQAKRQRS